MDTNNVSQSWVLEKRFNLFKNLLFPAPYRTIPLDGDSLSAATQISSWAHEVVEGLVTSPFGISSEESQQMISASLTRPMVTVHFKETTTETGDTGEGTTTMIFRGRSTLNNVLRVGRFNFGPLMETDLESASTAFPALLCCTLTATTHGIWLIHHVNDGHIRETHFGVSLPRASYQWISLPSSSARVGLE
jgi:hypothetical protein